MSKKNEDLKNFASKWNAKSHTEWSETEQAEARARYENDPAHKRWANEMAVKKPKRKFIRNPKYIEEVHKESDTRLEKQKAYGKKSTSKS